uniref:Chromosome 6 open reading frame 132 n=1 Tax=Pelusios castaneus TaxID=367368 RepID=A0A8C8SHB2_9SAUR
MKKNNSVQGTFSKLFGKKHANNTNTTSLYASNPPWIFTPEFTSEGKGDVVELYYGDNRYTTVTDSGTATLKPRPRVRPLLTFIPLSAQETHGVAVPTPSVPEGFEGKTTPGLGPQINGNHRMYSSVGDLRSKGFEREYLDNDIPPPPPMAPPPPPPPMAPPPPPLEIPLPPQCTAPPPPPLAASLSTMAPPPFSSSTFSSPSPLSPPDFIPPAPPLEFSVPPAPPLPPPAPPLPPPAPPTFLAPTATASISNGVSKWKSETVLNTRQTDTRGNALKVPPTTPVRSSSIPTDEKDSCEEGGPISREPHTRPPLPPSFTIRPAAKMRSAGEAEQTSALDRQTVTRPTWQISAPVNPRAGSDSSKGNNSNSSQSSLSEAAMVPLEKTKKEVGPKSELPAAEEELDVPSPDYTSSDDDWKEPSNLNRLKQELSALLSSSSKREERQLDKPITPRPTNSVTDQASPGGSKQANPTWKDPKFPAGEKSERKEKVPPSACSAKENSSDVVLTAAGNKSTSTQANSVMKFRNELEALLSPTKEGKPPLGAPNHRHSPGTKTVTPKHSGSSPTNFSDSRLLKPVANQLPPTAAPVEVEKTQENCETPTAFTGNEILENLTPVSKYLLSDNAGKSPNPPQKPKDQLVVPASPSPSSTEAASPIQTSGPHTDFSLVQYKIHRAKSSSTDSLSSLTPSQPGEERPVSANKPDVERGTLPCSTKNPGASSEPASSKNAGQEDDDALIHPVTGEKVEKGSPMALLLAAKQRAQRGRLSTSRQNSCTSKKPHMKLSEKFSSSSSHSETGSTNFYYSESKPYSFVVVPKSLQKESPGPLERRQRDRLDTPEGQAPDPHPKPALSLPSPPPSSSPTEEEENGEKLDYGIIPPPPEFSNDASRRDIRRSSYGNNYAPPSRMAPDSSTRNSDSRPLIKKRLYLAEPDSSYPRTSTSSGTYGHSAVGYGSPAAEGMRRVNSTHRNVPSSMQSRRMSLEPPGKTMPYSNATTNATYKGQSGDYSAAATSRPAPGNSLNSTPVNTFTVRPGTRQPISYTSYWGRPAAALM